jgi:16S rRNA (adenine1518-N6/adenine1519-N6)-dimethyltransferase
MPAKKRYGQHFLNERGYVERILTALAPQADERIIEIGPGEGALTLPLLRRTRQLTAIELDATLLPRLTRAAAGVGELAIIARDVLQVSFTELAAGGKLRVVGNLPYYIASPIVFHCLDHVDAISDMHFMLQKEVVARMAARPGNKTYGRLSVMVQLACRVEPLFDVPPSAFRPPPKVDSSVVRLTPRPPAARPDVDAAQLAIVVKAAFGQRRKTLANALRGMLDPASLQAIGIDPRARAEALAPGEFVRMAQHLARRLA